MNSSTDAPTEPQRLNREELFDQLSRATDSRSGEDQVVWIIFSIFWAANVGLLIAMFSGGDLPKRDFIGVVVALVGVVLSAIWRFIQQRAMGHMHRFELLMERIEKELRLHPQFALSPKINKDDHKKTVGPQFGTGRSVMRWSCWGSLVFWLIALALYLAHIYGAHICGCI